MRCILEVMVEVCVLIGFARHKYYVLFRPRQGRLEICAFTVCKFFTRNGAMTVVNKTHTVQRVCCSNNRMD
jgi:hypothetical protein